MGLNIKHTAIDQTDHFTLFQHYPICQSCRENHLDFMTVRFWIGFWIFFMLLVIVAFDLSALVRYITRFTEESFTVLISLIFIFEAFSKVAEIWNTNTVRTGVMREDKTTPWLYQCHCIPQQQNGTIFDDVSKIGGQLTVKFSLEREQLVSKRLNVSNIQWKGFS